MTVTPAGPTGRDAARLDRRTFLQRLAGVALTSTVGVALLEACAPRRPAAPTSAPGPRRGPLRPPRQPRLLLRRPQRLLRRPPRLLRRPQRLPLRHAAPDHVPGRPTAHVHPARRTQARPARQFAGPRPRVLPVPEQTWSSPSHAPGDGSDVSAIGIITQAAPPADGAERRLASRQQRGRAPIPS